MINSLFNLSVAQSARFFSLPAKFSSPYTFLTDLYLEYFRERNAALDTFFYDISVITKEDAARLAPQYAAKGSIVVSHPTKTGHAVELFASIEAFAEHYTAQISALVVAGVGSSALGAAAFACNVANAVGRPVAAVVSGYGVTDVIQEGLGGYYCFGFLNTLREDSSTFPAIDAGILFKPVEEKFEDLAWHTKDTETVLELLKDTRFNFTLLAGHSKGNLILSEALYALQAQDKTRFEAIYNKTNIITFSAVIKMPEGTQIIDVIGAKDILGAINSRPSIKPDMVVAGAGHHTNTQIPGYLSITEYTAKALKCFTTTDAMQSGNVSTSETFLPGKRAS